MGKSCIFKVIAIIISIMNCLILLKVKAVNYAAFTFSNLDYITHYLF